ncbi:DUF2059 domain-containing protein [Paragemmobacter straminiformis]|uniref:DUF2059 domain-containing protein n=1 Tax=Paragemmobacter straminiformis TaxID=2045119 RepID=A0A842IEW0_9RHOB|nr:DUF2059 domain-containing protein [Gemmobacter straminiformis]MBC2837424.1 DUF2059 domain-containing protein [Gemmobacter straminiformis]
MTRTFVTTAVARGALVLLLASAAAFGVLAAGQAQEAAGQGAAGQGPEQAQSAAVSQLISTMQIDQVIELLRVEGVDYGKSIEDEMFPGAGGAGWVATVGKIYDPVAMKAAFAGRLSAELGGKEAEVAGMEAFFGSDLGQRVLKLELEARRALLDDDTEAAADLAWGDLDSGDAARAGLIRKFAEVNDLVDSNVMGALNSNLAFYQGMAATGGFAGEMPEDQMLSDVWGQEPDIRRETEAWVYPYLNLAYGPLSDAELQAYIDFSATPEGQVLNGALFAAFDAVFTPISKALGTAAALQIQGQDI